MDQWLSFMSELFWSWWWFSVGCVNFGGRGGIGCGGGFGVVVVVMVVVLL